MRWICLSLGFALMAFSVFAQDQKDAATQSSTSVVVNGQPIKGKVLEIDGKHFVAVEDLAQSLRGTLSYRDGQVALTIAPPPAGASAQPPVPEPMAKTAAPPAAQPSVRTAQLPPSPPLANTSPPLVAPAPVAAGQSAESGNVKGTLTYFVNFHDGSKPDTGTKIWLVKDHVEIPADQNFVGSSGALGAGANPEQYTAIKYAVADSNGNFELLEVPPGQYTLILQSAHTKGTLKDKRNLFGRGNRPNLRDSVGRVESLGVLIKPGETVNASKDFGPNVE
jgi:hypothetical protein